MVAARREQDAAEGAKLAEAEAATAAAREEEERRLKEDPLYRETWERGQARNRAAENIRRAAEMAKLNANQPPPASAAARAATPARPAHAPPGAAAAPAPGTDRGRGGRDDREIGRTSWRGREWQ